MLGEPEKPFDVELIEHRVSKFHFGEGDLLAELVALTFVRPPVNRPFMQKRLVDTIKPLRPFANDLLKTRTQVFGFGLACPPNVQNYRSKKTHVSGFRLQLREQLSKSQLEFSFLDLHAATFPAVIVRVLLGSAGRPTAGQRRGAVPARHESP